MKLTVTSALTAGFQDLCLFEAEFLPFLQLQISWFLLIITLKDMRADWQSWWCPTVDFPGPWGKRAPRQGGWPGATQGMHYLESKHSRARPSCGPTCCVTSAGLLSLSFLSCDIRNAVSLPVPAMTRVGISSEKWHQCSEKYFLMPFPVPGYQDVPSLCSLPCMQVAWISA